MKEYIEREAATAYAPLPKHLREYQTMNVDDAWEDGYDFAIGQVEAIPAADVVEVRHGRWIDSEEDGHLSICGVCNYPVDRFFKTKYCPNCGAKMDGGADDGRD